MPLRTVVPSEGSITPLDEEDQYYCPVCGIGLTLSSFQTPQRDYYCPNCTTRQTPSLF